MRAAARLDGKFALCTNDYTLTAEDLALGCKRLQRVGQVWRSLKSRLRMRQVFHWAVHRIHPHRAISVLAPLIEHVIEHGCGDTGRNIQDELRQIRVAHFSTQNRQVSQETELREAAVKHLKSLKIPPRPIHRLG